MAGGSGLIRLALFGDPVRRSLSPRIHRQFARQGALELEYEALQTPAGELAAALERFHDRGGVGCNVTLPLKREALVCAATCSDQARIAGAANTLRWERGTWHAENTDGAGLLMDLRACNLYPAGRHVAILGAGGATAGILGALLRARPARVAVFNRTESAARELAAAHEDLGPVTAHPLSSLEGSDAFELIINATSLGHNGEAPPLTKARFTRDGACYDLNYGIAAEPLRDLCREQEVDYADGLGMLVRQAAESFRLWTGYAPLAGPVVNRLRRDFGDR